MTYIDFKLKEYLLLKSKFEFVPLLSTIKLIPSSNKLSKKHYLENGKYPIVDQGNSLISGYTNENDPTSIKECIVFGDHTRIIKYIDFPFYPGADGIKIFNSKNENIFLTKFIFYYINSLEITNLGYSRHWKLFEDFKIPLIPLKIQEKIVEILERFRILEAELKAELKAELEARGKQFDFWINKLLNFTNFDKNNSKELQSIGCFISGLRSKNKDSFVNGNQRYVSYLDVFNNKEINYLPNNFVKIFNDENQNDLNYGDVIFCGSSENFDETGYASVYTIKNNEKVYLNSFSFIFRFKDNNLFLPKFSKYFFNCKDFRDLLLKCINGVTRFNLSKEKMSKIKIPIPPLEVQNKIVSLLDKLSEYSQEINSGLPAEIELRSKQFKYYRDQLLNFKNNE